MNVLEDREYFTVCVCVSLYEFPVTTNEYHCIRTHADILIPTSAQTRSHIHTRSRSHDDDVESRINDIKRKGCVTIDILRVQSHAICLYAALYIELESSGSLFRRSGLRMYEHITLVTQGVRVRVSRASLVDLARRSLFHLVSPCVCYMWSHRSSTTETMCSANVCESSRPFQVSNETLCQNIE